MNVMTTVLTALGIAMLFMFTLWLISGLGKRGAWVDVGWALTIGILAVFFGLTGSGDALRRTVLIVLPAIWSLRLAWHVYIDRVHKDRGDTRYDQLHEDWGSESRWRFCLFFQMQAVLAFLLTLPFFLASIDGTPLSIPYALGGVLLFFTALSGEVLADRQLSRFKADPANRTGVCRTGLWKYSRHPNYFFEWLHWLSYAILIAETQFWWTSVLCALTMLVLVLFITGIPPTEAQSLKNRGAAFKKYQEETSAFFPWFPKQ